MQNSEEKVAFKGDNWIIWVLKSEEEHYADNMTPHSLKSESH